MSPPIVSRSLTARRAVLASLGALLASACGSAQAEAPAAREPAAAPILVATARAEASVLPQTLAVTGSLEAYAAADIAPAVDGRVSAALVERGQEVEEGAVLFLLDERDAANRLEEALAVQSQLTERLALKRATPFDPERTSDVREARVSLERAEVEHRRYERLVGEGAVSRSEHDVKRAAWLEAKERHASAVERARESHRALEAQRARVALARKALEDTRVRAPFAGAVMERLCDVGQYVRTGTPLARLVRTHPLRAELEIPEAAVASVSAKQKVALSVQAWPGRRFEGEIAFIGPGLDRASRTLVVEALVPNAAGLLRPGLFATGSIEVHGSRPSVLVPAEAVVDVDGARRLFVVDGASARQRFVQVGREVGGRLEIVRGLEAGEIVVVQGVERLSDGAAVVAGATEER